jgi:hypothetical protein
MEDGDCFWICSACTFINQVSILREMIKSVLERAHAMFVVVQVGKTAGEKCEVCGLSKKDDDFVLTAEEIIMQQEMERTQEDKKKEERQRKEEEQVRQSLEKERKEIEEKEKPATGTCAQPVASGGLSPGSSSWDSASSGVANWPITHFPWVRVHRAAGRHRGQARGRTEQRARRLGRALPPEVPRVRKAQPPHGDQLHQVRVRSIRVVQSYPST